MISREAGLAVLAALGSDALERMVKHSEADDGTLSLTRLARALEATARDLRALDEQGWKPAGPMQHGRIRLYNREAALDEALAGLQVETMRERA